MEEYFQKRKENGLDSTYFRKKLKQLGKSDEEVHEIFMELDDDWTKELLFENEIKYRRLYLTVGLIIGIGACILAILGALGFFMGGRLLVVWTGGIAGGFTLAIKGYFAGKNAKLRADRRRIKYKMFK